MITFLIYILAFIIITLLLFGVGSQLIIYADAVSEKTKISQLWIGMILLSIITSLPELVSNLAAVLIIHEPNLALGNIIGSNIFNLTILFVIEMIFIGNSIFNVIHKNYIKAIKLSLVITGIILLQIVFFTNVKPVNFLGINFYPDLSVGFISGASILIFIGYFTGIKFYMKDLSFDEESLPVEEKYLHLSKQTVIFRFIFFGALIVILGIIMSILADKIALFELKLKYSSLILGHTFVGSLFLALATSLPELVVSIQAIRKINSVNMAIGNIFGSNLFNLLIICISDIFYFRNPLFHDVSYSHIISIGVFVLMASIVSFGIMNKRKHKRTVSIESILILIIYIIYLFLIYHFRIIDTP
ncbi:hypothetical protein KAU33_11135 [Candidatus Dependentiae bacterium]|nr:hypothetical protein [Candidatus Dependentiae bacterium]